MPAIRYYGGKTVKQHAEELGERTETVRGWLNNHGMPHEEPERSKWVAQWKKVNLKRPKFSGTGDPGDDLIRQKHAADLRGRVLRNASLALDVERKKGNLISVDEAKKMQARLAGMLKQKFLELPSAVCDLIDPENPQRVREILEREIYDRLEEMSGRTG